MKKENLIGKKYNRLTIIKEITPYITKEGYRHKKVLCKCECGNRIEVTLNALKSNNTKSCGCLQKEILRKRNKSIEFKDKRKEGMLKKYGVEYPSQSKEIKNKIKTTNLKKYGVECTLQSKEIRDKIKVTILKNYGVEYPSQSKEI